MKRYSVGFAFSPDNSKVVLIAKTRPAWQAGRLNGVGGHIEEGETPMMAMDREFREETCCVERLDWKPFGRLHGNDWEVWLFYAHYPTAQIYNEHEEGVVSVHHVSVVCSRSTSKNTPPLSSLRYLIPMAINHITGEDKAEFFDIKETQAPVELSEL